MLDIARLTFPLDYAYFVCLCIISDLIILVLELSHCPISSLTKNINTEEGIEELRMARNYCSARYLEAADLIFAEKIKQIDKMRTAIIV